MSGKSAREERREERLQAESQRRAAGAPQAVAADRQRRGLHRGRRGRGADRDQLERKQRRRHQPRGRRPGQGKARGHPAVGPAARRPQGDGDALRVRRPAVPGLQILLRTDRAGSDRIAGPHRRSEARIPQLPDHQPGIVPGRRRRDRRGQPGPRLELHRALLPQPGQGGLGLRHRRIPHRSRQGRRRPRHRQVEQGTQELQGHRRSRKHPTRKRSSSASPARRPSPSKARERRARKPWGRREKPACSKKRSKKPPEGRSRAPWLGFT